MLGVVVRFGTPVPSVFLICFKNIHFKFLLILVTCGVFIGVVLIRISHTIHHVARIIAIVTWVELLSLIRVVHMPLEVFS